MQDIDLVVSFGDAHKKCDNLPQRAKVENWPVPEEFKAEKGGAAELSTIRDERDKIDKRVFALFLDHWRNNADHWRTQAQLALPKPEEAKATWWHWLRLAS